MTASAVQSVIAFASTLLFILVAVRATSIGPSSSLSLSTTWQTLGPFQIGTREATWGADPLERLGGFRNLTLQTDATFVSSLGRAASVKWFEAEAKQILSACDAVQADLVLQFDEIDFAGLQGVYGWPALQYQAWTRGHIFVGQEHAQTVLLYIEGVLEFYVDEEHYFGGDVYSFGKIPVVLKLSPGHHRLDIRLIRDVRAMGAIVSPAINVRIKAELSSPGLTILESHEMLPDVVDGQLSSSVASLLVRNDDEKSVEIIDVEVMGNLGQAALDNSSLPKSLVPGQTRSLTVRISCRATCPETLEFVVVARKSSAATGHRSYRVKSPAFNIRYRSLDEVFKLTYRHPTGTVGYVMLKAPHIESWTSRSGIKDTLPIMLVLHGAGLEADAAELTRSLDDAGKLGAFVIFPTGGSPWSGDDWHQSGSIHVESAVLATEEWARSSGWSGPKPRIDHWLVVGHSNGGQGTWYTLTHHPDRVAGAAALSGYSSIQNYVPYHFWHPMDPSIQAILEGSLLSYRHELLWENMRDIPILQQHGSADDNVPPYHSRLMRQLADEMEANVTYNELKDRGHWFNTIMTTKPLTQFYHQQLSDGHLPRNRTFPLSVVSPRPLDTFDVQGARILELNIPGRIGRVKIDKAVEDGVCHILTRNVAAFKMSDTTLQCKTLLVDSQVVPSGTLSQQLRTFEKRDKSWSVSGDEHLVLAPVSPGGMDAFLRTKLPLSIWRTGSDPAIAKIALQMSRNLLQYHGIDGLITDKNTENTTLAAIMLGGSLSIPERRWPSPDGIQSHFPALQQRLGEPLSILAGKASIEIRDSEGGRHLYSGESGPVGAIFLSASPDPSIPAHLNIWGSDAEGLDIAARLAPLLTGVGQPDFIVADRHMMTQGAAGLLALGFFTGNYSCRSCPWTVSANAFFA